MNTVRHRPNNCLHEKGFDMEIRELKISEIQPAAYNPRKDLQPGDAAYEKLRKGIDRFDLVEPLVWNQRTGNLVGGHQRLKILKARGDAVVQAVIVDLGDAEEKALNLALNKVSGEWDLLKLGDLLGDLSRMELDMSLTGFDLDEITALQPHGGLRDEDDVPDVPAEPVTKPTDMWLAGQHRILCGDSTNAGDVHRLLNGGEPMLMVTDPPYGIEYDPGWRQCHWRGARATGRVPGDDREDWQEAWALFAGDVAYVWHAGTKADVAALSLAACGFEIRGQIIWAKQHFVISRGHYHGQHEPCWYAVRRDRSGHWAGDRKQTTLWQIANRNAFGGSLDDTSTIHGTQKPVECMRRPILNHTTVGEGVYEPFLGSGSLLIAAEATGRMCYGLDIDPAYVDCAVLRWQRYTGRPAVLDGASHTFEDIRRQRNVQKAG